MNLDEEPFLDEMDFSNQPSEKTQQMKYASPTLLAKTKSFFTKEKARSVLVSKWLAIGNWVIIVLSILSIVSTRNKLAAVKRYCPEIPYSPALSSLQWENRAPDYHGHNPFAGELKTPEMVRAWEELKIHEILRVTKKELELSHGYDENSLALINGGYMSVMRVFHEIHCLDWIKREWNADRPEMMDHLDHCFIALRDGIMCKGDLSVGSLYWWPENKSEQKHRPEAPRSCVNWKSLENWMIPRRLEIHNSVAEAPVTPDGRLIAVILNDDLHTVQDLGET